MMVIRKPCDVCGTPFPARSHRARYCSDRCRVDSATEMRRKREGRHVHPRFCELAECGVVFTPRNNRARYHSKACVDRANYLAKQAYNQTRPKASSRHGHHFDADLVCKRDGCRIVWSPGIQVPCEGAPR